MLLMECAKGLCHLVQKEDCSRYYLEFSTQALQTAILVKVLATPLVV